MKGALPQFCPMRIFIVFIGQHYQQVSSFASGGEAGDMKGSRGEETGARQEGERKGTGAERDLTLLVAQGSVCLEQYEQSGSQLLCL